MNLHFLIYVIIGFSILSVIVPLSLAAIQWKKIPSDIQSLRWLLVAALISDLGQLALGLLGINNLWLGSLFMYFQFTILLYIFYVQFDRKAIFKFIFASVVLLYVSLWFVNKTTLTLVKSNAIDGLVLIIVSFAFFYKLLNELKVVAIHRLPILWIAFGTLFYYSGNLFVFLSKHYFENDSKTFMAFWSLHNVLNITKNLLFAVALWQSYRTVKSLK